MSFETKRYHVTRKRKQNTKMSDSKSHSALNDNSIDRPVPYTYKLLRYATVDKMCDQNEPLLLFLAKLLLKLYLTESRWPELSPLVHHFWYDKYCLYAYNNDVNH